MTETRRRLWLTRHAPQPFAPLDAASLGALRILFGVLLTVLPVRFWAQGWIEEVYLVPPFHFTYWGFGWLRPLPDPAMFGLFLLLSVLGACLTLGWRTRFAAGGYFLLFTYAELLEKAAYLNHYYFVSLLTFLLVFLPTERAWSIDARRSALPQVVPALAVWLLRFQVGVVYFFAGLAKLQPDWLVRAEPLSTWLSAYVALPVLGPILASPATALVMSWMGAFFDLTAPLGLSQARLRPVTYAAVVFFHVATWLLFPIGMFPWVMIAAATVFFPPSWPRRFLGARTIPSGAAAPTARAPSGKQGLAWLALPYCLLQLVLPLRHLAYPGDVNWTERGFRFAWRVMLVEKSGLVEFRLVSSGPHGEPIVRTVHPRHLLSTLQYRQMRTQPDMILQLGQELARRAEQDGARGVQVYADAWVSYNGRPSQRLIRPDANLRWETLATAQRWLLPLAPGPGARPRASTPSGGNW